MCQGCFIVEHDEILAIVVSGELICCLYVCMYVLG